MLREYIWLVGMLSYQYPGQLLRVHTDHLGTVRAVSQPNTANTVVWRWEGDQFGDVMPTGNLIMPLRHPGQYYDAEVGTFYNYFRDYDPATGRYLQSDPIGLDGGLNTYGYVSANPLLLSDPQGLACRVVFNFLLGQIQACDRSPPLTSGGWQSDGSLTHPDKYDQSEAINCSSSDDCAQITWSIDVLVRQIKFYRADAQKHQRQGRSGGVQDHKYFYEKTLQKELKRLIALAKAKGCPYNPEADVEATRSFNYPTPYNY